DLLRGPSASPRPRLQLPALTDAGGPSPPAGSRGHRSPSNDEEEPRVLAKGNLGRWRRSPSLLLAPLRVRLGGASPSVHPATIEDDLHTGVVLEALAKGLDHVGPGRLDDDEPPRSLWPRGPLCWRRPRPVGPFRHHFCLSSCLSLPCRCRPRSADPGSRSGSPWTGFSDRVAVG